MAINFYSYFTVIDKQKNIHSFIFLAFFYDDNEKKNQRITLSPKKSKDKKIKSKGTFASKNESSFGPYQ